MDLDSASWLGSSGSFRTMTDFQTIAAVILEKHGIVAMDFIISRAFNVPGSRSHDNLSQSINLSVTLCPEGDPALIGDMSRRFGDTKKLGGPVRSGRFVRQPAFDPDAACEPHRRKDGFVEGASFGQTGHSEINVIVSPRHQDPSSL
jgi:hypothetical protein